MDAKEKKAINRAYNKAWREANHDKALAWSRAYYEANRKKKQARQRRRTQELATSYVAGTCRIRASEAPPGLIEAKREQLLLNRALKDLKAELRKTKYLTPLAQETRTHITTKEAAGHMHREAQTLRAWACKENGPIRPTRINGRLAWPVADIRTLLEMTGEMVGVFATK